MCLARLNTYQFTTGGIQIIIIFEPSVDFYLCLYIVMCGYFVLCERPWRSVFSMEIKVAGSVLIWTIPLQWPNSSRRVSEVGTRDFDVNLNEKSGPKVG